MMKGKEIGGSSAGCAGCRSYIYARAVNMPYLMFKGHEGRLPTNVPCVSVLCYNIPKISLENPRLDVICAPGVMSVDMS
jgi:hypothetical protein